MNEQSISRIDEFLADATLGLFRSLGIEAKAFATAKGGSRGEIGATIGLAAVGLHGAIILTLSRATAKATLPPSLRAETATDEILADWGGELANQLLGKLKVHFGKAGIDVAIGTPVAFIGEDMQHFSPSPTVSRQFTCVLPTGRASAEFEADCTASFEVGEPSKDGAALEDGDFQLF